MQRHQRKLGIVASVGEERNKGEVPTWGPGVSRDHTPWDTQAPYICMGCTPLMAALFGISRSHPRHRKSHTWAACRCRVLGHQRHLVSQTTFWCFGQFGCPCNARDSKWRVICSRLSWRTPRQWYTSTIRRGTGNLALDPVLGTSCSRLLDFLNRLSLGLGQWSLYIEVFRTCVTGRGYWM